MFLAQGRICVGSKCVCCKGLLMRPLSVWGVWRLKPRSAGRLACATAPKSDTEAGRGALPVGSASGNGQLRIGVAPTRKPRSVYILN